MFFSAKLWRFTFPLLFTHQIDYLLVKFILRELYYFGIRRGIKCRHVFRSLTQIIRPHSTGMSHEEHCDARAVLHLAICHIAPPFEFPSVTAIANMAFKWMCRTSLVRSAISHRRSLNIQLHPSYLVTPIRRQHKLFTETVSKAKCNNAGTSSFSRSVSCSPWTRQKIRSLDEQTNDERDCAQKPHAVRKQDNWFPENFKKLQRSVNNSNFNAAWSQFNNFKRIGQVDKKMVTMMLKMCTCSDSQKDFLDRLNTRTLQRIDVKNNYVALLMIAKTMQIECRFRDAQNVIQQASDMARGKKATKHVIAIRDSTDVSLSKQRVQRLNHLIKGGKTQEAWELFDRIERHGKANIFHYTAMLKACIDSEETRGFLGYMKRNGIRPNLRSYTTLLNRLRIEADDDAVRELLTKQLPAAGLKPDKYMLSERPEAWLVVFICHTPFYRTHVPVHLRVKSLLLLTPHSLTHLKRYPNIRRSGRSATC